jgi:aerobic carbon-monoxide dehydrogenase small subunit
MSRVTVALTVNGVERHVEVEPRWLLSDVLRDQGLTSVHVGCEHGVCGACTVQVDGLPMRSCLLFAVQMEGHAIRTVEDLAPRGGLAPLQQALHDEHGLQCGFCTPGILMTMDAFLARLPEASDEELREVLSGHLCRCTGYQNILRALRRVQGRAEVAP